MDGDVATFWTDTLNSMPLGSLSSPRQSPRLTESSRSKDSTRLTESSRSKDSTKEDEKNAGTFGRNIDATLRDAQAAVKDMGHILKRKPFRAVRLHPLPGAASVMRATSKAKRRSNTKPRIVPNHVRTSSAWTSINVRKLILEAFEKEAKSQFSNRVEIHLGNEVVIANKALHDVCSVIRHLDVDIFKRFSDMQLRFILPVMQIRYYGAGEWVMRKGEQGDGFYVVFSGGCDIFPDESHPPVVTLKEGKSFGEQSLLTDAPRNASIMASTDTTLGFFLKEHQRCFFDPEGGGWV